MTAANVPNASAILREMFRKFRAAESPEWLAPECAGDCPRSPPPVSPNQCLSMKDLPMKKLSWLDRLIIKIALAKSVARNDLPVGACAGDIAAAFALLNAPVPPAEQGGFRRSSMAEAVADEVPGADDPMYYAGDDYSRVGCRAAVDVYKDGYALRIYDPTGRKIEGYAYANTPEDIARMLNDWCEGRVPRPAHLRKD